MRPVILIVEDIAADRVLMAEALADVGVACDICSADSCDLAYRQLVAGHAAGRLPDLVISVLRLPRVDGGKLLRLIRADPRIAHLPVVVVAGSGRDDDRRQCTDANAFLVKGATWDDSVANARMIAALLGERRPVPHA